MAREGVCRVRLAARPAEFWTSRTLVVLVVLSCEKFLTQGPGGTWNFWGRKEVGWIGARGLGEGEGGRGYGC